jgi:hypothetical protein
MTITWIRKTMNVIDEDGNDADDNHDNDKKKKKN